MAIVRTVLPRKGIIQPRHGDSYEADLDTMADVCAQIAGRSFCALGDAAATPFPAAMKFFRDEFEAGVSTPAEQTFNPMASTIFVKAKG